MTIRLSQLLQPQLMMTRRKRKRRKRRRPWIQRRSSRRVSTYHHSNRVRSHCRHVLWTRKMAVWLREPLRRASETLEEGV
jgi:hypothetical protein